MSETFYKVTGADGQSIHGGTFQWPLPIAQGTVEIVGGKEIGYPPDPADAEYTPGDWTEPIPESRIDICRVGFHLTSQPDRWWKPGARYFEAEPGKIITREEDKIVTPTARLLRETPVPDYLHRVSEFIATIPEVPFGQADGDPDPEWKLFTAPDLDAAWDAARAATLDAARDAAWDAARAAARDAAWDAAWDAARAATLDAARDAARAAARAAARDAGLEAWMVLVDDLETVDTKHRKHSQKRWEVYKKGYFVYCDINGILYCYGVDKGK